MTTGADKPNGLVAIHATGVVAILAIPAVCVASPGLFKMPSSVPGVRA